MSRMPFVPSKPAPDPSENLKAIVQKFGHFAKQDDPTDAIARLEAEIMSLRALLMVTRNYVDRDHYGMLAEIDTALSRT